MAIRHARALARPSAALAVFVVAVGLAVLVACGSSLPAPPSMPQPASDFVTVPFPPPPARVETVPERPTSEALWVDGGWFYEGTRWRWHAGGWYDAPGLFFSKWVTQRSPDGRLLFANATWRDASGAKVNTPKVLAEAVRANAVDAGADAAPPKTEFEATATTKESARELEAGAPDASSDAASADGSTPDAASSDASPADGGHTEGGAS